MDIDKQLEELREQRRIHTNKYYKENAEFNKKIDTLELLKHSVDFKKEWVLYEYDSKHYYIYVEQIGRLTNGIRLIGTVFITGYEEDYMVFYKESDITIKYDNLQYIKRISAKDVSNFLNDKFKFFNNLVK